MYNRSKVPIDEKIGVKRMSEKKPAEKKEHKIISASTGAKTSKGASQPAARKAAPVGNSKTLRIGAVALWVGAIVFEVLAILVAVGKMDLMFIPTLWQMILFLVLDLVCLAIGSQLWKKANHIDPASAKNKLKFWLWNNLGVIVAVFAFLPFIIVLFTNKDVNQQTKKIGIIVAAAALAIGVATGIDYNPVSKEQKDAAEQVILEDVYWTNSLGGKVYHTHDDCASLNRTEELVIGKVEQAIASNRARLCYYCAHKDGLLFLLEDPVDPAKVTEYLAAHPVSDLLPTDDDNNINPDEGGEAPAEGPEETQAPETEVPNNDGEEGGSAD